MRRLAFLIAAILLIWSVWWIVGARGTEGAVRGWLEAQEGPGRVAEGAVATRGFPMRFDTTVTDLRIGDPRGLIWEAETFQLLMLAYAPNRAVVAFPGPQRIVTPAGTVTAEAERATASARVGVDADLPLTAFTLVARALGIEGPGWRAGVEEARLATRAAQGLGGVEAPEGAQHLGVLVSGLTLPPQLYAAAPALDGLLPRRVANVRLDAVATLDTPIDRHAAETPPRLVSLEVGSLELDWGDLSVRAGPGTVQIGRDGRPFGRIEMRVDGWQRMLEGLVIAGLIPERQAPLAIASLTVIADGDPEGALDLPLIFEGGRMRLGPVPLGAAPVLPPPR